jgi:hypothetical protein
MGNRKPLASSVRTGLGDGIHKRFFGSSKWKGKPYE